MFNTSDNGYRVNFALDLGSATGIGHAFRFQAGYLNYGQGFYTPYGAAEADYNENDFFNPGNANGITLGASIKPLDWLTVYRPSCSRGDRGPRRRKVQHQNSQAKKA